MSSEDLDSNDSVTEILSLTQDLLDAIAAGDWERYTQLCDPNLSCFEPEALGHLVEGMDFHKYYFDLNDKPGVSNTTISMPHVRLLGEDAAIVSYVRLVQRLQDGSPVTVRSEETRVWEKQDGVWQHVHFHRSVPPRA